MTSFTCRPDGRQALQHSAFYTPSTCNSFGCEHPAFDWHAREACCCSPSRSSFESTLWANKCIMLLVWPGPLHALSVSRLFTALGLRMRTLTAAVCVPTNNCRCRNTDDVHGRSTHGCCHCKESTHCFWTGSSWFVTVTRSVSSQPLQPQANPGPNTPRTSLHATTLI